MNAELSEIVPPSDGIRLFEGEFRAGFADCAPSGRARLDGIARWLQEVAYADVEDAGLHFHAVWVVRRTRLSIRRFPRFAELQRAVTFCGGLGRMWANRRTTIGRPGEEPDIEAVSLWVHLSPDTWMPSRFSDDEIAIYGHAVPERKISHRLRQPPPGEDAAELGRWHFRAAECDIARHVNNAAYLQILEEELITSGRDPESLEVEIEYRTPAQPGEMRILGDGPRRWVSGAGDGELHAAAILLEGA